MAKQTIMTIAEFKQLLQKFSKEVTDDFQIWLSSDDEGNEFLPMFRNSELSLAIDPEQKRIILFPADGCYFQENRK